MPAEVAIIVTVITKLAPKLYDKALEAFESKAMKPNAGQRELMKEYLAVFIGRRAFENGVRDEFLDPVISSVDEVRLESHRYVAKLHSYPRGRIMIEAILVSCKRFLDKWAVHRGKGYNVTYDGRKRLPLGGGGRRSVAIYEAFSLDLLQLRRDVNLLLSGTADIIRSGAPTWNGRVLGDIAPAVVGSIAKSKLPKLVREIAAE